MFLSAPRYLVVALTLLVLVGHLCELPIEAVGSGHGHADGSGSAHHHDHDRPADEARIACDPVVGIRLDGGAFADRSASVAAGSVPPPHGASVQVALVPRGESRGLPRRPPLFLLHSSLLI